MEKSEFRITYSKDALRIIQQLTESLTDDYATDKDDEPLHVSLSIHGASKDVCLEIKIWSVTNGCCYESEKIGKNNSYSNTLYDTYTIRNTNGKVIADLFSKHY